jgi:hypothetical protein
MGGGGEGDYINLKYAEGRYDVLFKVLQQHLVEGLRKTHNNVYHRDSWPPLRKSNTGPPEHEVEVTNVQPRR